MGKFKTVCVLILLTVAVACLWPRSRGEKPITIKTTGDKVYVDPPNR